MRKTRAFTLLEMTLVLAIVGIVVGAIWVGYAGVLRNSRILQQERQIADLVEIARDYLQHYNEDNSLIYSANGNAKDITNNLITAGAIPASVRTNTGNSFYFLRYGIATVWTLNSTGNPYGTGPMIEVAVTGLNKQACLDVLNIWGGSPSKIKASAMVGIMAATTSADLRAQNLFAAINLPNRALNLGQMTAACPATGNTNLLTLVFRLNP